MKILIKTLLFVMISSYVASTFCSNDTNAQFESALHQLDVEAVKRYATPSNVNMTDNNGFKPLFLVCQRYANVSLNKDEMKKICEVAKILLTYGADVNAITPEGNYAIYPAIKWGYCYGRNDPEEIKMLPELLKILLEAGADPNSVKKDKAEDIEEGITNTPLFQAAGHARNPKMVQLLLEHGADADFTDRTEKSLLVVNVWKSLAYVDCCNCENHDKEAHAYHAISKLLLEYGASIKNCLTPKTVEWIIKDFGDMVHDIKLVLNELLQRSYLSELDRVTTIMLLQQLDDLDLALISKQLVGKNILEIAKMMLPSPQGEKESELCKYHKIITQACYLTLTNPYLTLTNSDECKFRSTYAEHKASFDKQLKDTIALLEEYMAKQIS